MKKIAFLVAAASLFAAVPIASRFGPVVSAVTLVWMAVLLAIFASGVANSTNVASGAIGAFGSGILAAVSPAAAGAVLVAAAFAERTTRVKSKTARAVHVLVALVGGALAGTLATAFTAASTPVFAVSIVCAAILAALPMLVEADDPVAHALEQAAIDVAEPAKASLIAGAELRRTAQDVPLDADTQARVKQTWKSLLRLAEARTRLERTRPRFRVATTEPSSKHPADQVLGMVDQKIADHVAVLGRAYTAVDTARAAAASLDTTALDNAAHASDSLEEVSRALAEVDVELPPSEQARIAT
jgi:MFS family permease